MNKFVFVGAAALALTACSHSDKPTPEAIAKATEACKDWNYKPGTRSFNACVKKISKEQ